MKTLRLVKITDLTNDKILYQIQKKNRFFGWIEYGNKKNCIQSTFYTLEEAKKYLTAYQSDSIYKIEVL